ncbi:molecular chaperone [Enterobacter hormaechei]|nr:molecular chaperone [Enterobacter hormaechei]
MTWKTIGGKLQAINKTPWNVSISGVKANGKKTEGKMIAPFDAESFPLQVRHGQTIHFDAVNDYGAVTEKSAAVQ